MLIHAHAPEAHEVALRVADEVGEVDEFLLEGFDRFVGVAFGELRDEVERVGFDPLLEFLFADAPVLAGGAARILLRDFFADLAALRNRLVGVELYDELTLHDVLFGRIGELVGVAKAKADVGHARREDAVLFDEFAVDLTAHIDFSDEIVEDRQVGARLEDDRFVGEARGEVAERRDVDEFRRLGRQLAVRDARPKNRVGFGHVVAPKEHGVGQFNVAVVVSGFVDAEGLIEPNDGRGHAKTSIRVDVVRAKAPLHEFRRGVGFGNRVLARADDRDSRGPLLLIDALELFRHFVEGLIPTDGLELAVLVELAVRAAHQRLRETVAAVGNLGVEIALDAVEPAVHGRVGVALRRDDAAVSHADEKAAARAAEAADALVPGDAVFRNGGGRFFFGGNGQADRHRGRGRKTGLEERAAARVDDFDAFFHCVGLRECEKREKGNQDSASSVDDSNR